MSAWWKSPLSTANIACAVQLRNVSRDRELERERGSLRQREREKRKRDGERDGETWSKTE